jgi:hypothetical protein
LCKHLDQPWLEAFSQLGSAFTHVYALRHEQAVRAMSEVADAFARAGDSHMRMFVALQIGLQKFLRGDDKGAGSSVLKALELARRIANPRGYTGICETTAYISIREGNAELAARLLGTAEAGRIISGAPIFPYWVEPHEEAWARVCELLGTAAADDLFASGKLAGPREGAQLAAVFLQPKMH